jgi:hypothetical protein
MRSRKDETKGRKKKDDEKSDETEVAEPDENEEEILFAGDEDEEFEFEVEEEPEEEQFAVEYSRVIHFAKKRGRPQGRPRCFCANPADGLH